jgi:hypothetical protein
MKLETLAYFAVGNYAVGLVAKRVESTISLGTLALAAMFADFAWGICMIVATVCMEVSISAPSGHHPQCPHREHDFPSCLCPDGHCRTLTIRWCCLLGDRVGCWATLGVASAYHSLSARFQPAVYLDEPWTATGRFRVLKFNTRSARAHCTDPKSHDDTLVSDLMRHAHTVLA